VGPKVFRIDFIHRDKVIRVREKHRAFHDACQTGAATLQKNANVLDRKLGLFPNAARDKLIGYRIDRPLPGYKQELGDAENWRVGTLSFWLSSQFRPFNHRSTSNSGLTNSSN
jgi:hypothetical protein